MNETPFAEPAPSIRFFERGDWRAFGITTGLVWIIYLFTMSPEIDLEYSGIFATSALYPGVAEPPGHPLWAIYGYLFIHLLPSGNIAWRLSVASALAGAVTSGLVALLVSRLGGLTVKTLVSHQTRRFQEMSRIRLICASVAGLALGLDTCVWRQAVVPETWTLELLLLALTVTILTRWMFAPEQRRFLYLAAFQCGLSLTESHANVPMVLGIPFLVVAADRSLGRNLFFLLALLLGVLYAMARSHSWRNAVTDELGGFPAYLAWMSFMALLIFLGLARRARRVFSEWRSSALCATLLFAGLGAYFLLPLYSLTDPPLNWGYPRTVEGFFHVVRREQFETLRPTHDLKIFLRELGQYFRSVRDDLGLMYLLIAILPLAVLFKLPPAIRNWLAGMLVFGLLLAFFTVLGLQLELSGSIVDFDKPFYASTHFVIVLFAGCGLMLIAAGFMGGAPAQNPSPNLPAQVSPPE